MFVIFKKIVKLFITCSGEMSRNIVKTNKTKHAVSIESIAKLSQKTKEYRNNRLYFESISES